jgi:hypothetical protein
VRQLRESGGSPGAISRSATLRGAFSSSPEERQRERCPDLLIDEAQEDLDANLKADSRCRKAWALWLWGKVARFGYDPLHTIWFMMSFVLFGWLVFGLGSYEGLIVPTDKDAFDEYVRGYDSKGERLPSGLLSGL